MLWIKELFYFLFKLARASLFAGIFFASLIFGKYVTTFGLHINDFLFICVILTQIILLLTKVETRAEVKVICVYHVLGLVMELFKTSPAIGAWQYPDPGLLTLRTVPLYSGFMYAAIGSFIFQARRLLELRFRNFPPFYLMIPVAVLIYINFFAHHWVRDIRYILLFVVILIARRTYAIIRLYTKTIQVHVLVGLFLCGFSIRIAENIGTFFGAWIYPDQLQGWHIVSIHKVLAWFLLFIVSFVIVSYMKTKEQKSINRDNLTIQKPLHIAFAGGGSGGHVRPIQSLIERWIGEQRKKGTEEKVDGDFLVYTVQHRLQTAPNFYRFGEKNSFEAKISCELQEKGIPLMFLPLISGKFRREKTLGAMIKNVRDLFLFCGGIFQALWYMLRYNIDIVFCKGGYVALPAVVACSLLGRKIIVHESDTTPGLVNRLATKVADIVFTGFPMVLPGGICIGQILSDELLLGVEHHNLCTESGKGNIKGGKLNVAFTPHYGSTYRLLVTGGGLGAKTLYTAIATVLQTSVLIRSMDIVVVGGLLQEDLTAMFSAFTCVRLLPFATPAEMGVLYMWADGCVIRGGTTTLAEATLFGLNTIIVPLPWTHDQKNNADWYVSQHGAKMFDQEDPSFLMHLQQELESMCSFLQRKKLGSQEEMYKYITKPKRLVWNAILDTY